MPPAPKIFASFFLARAAVTEACCLEFARRVASFAAAWRCFAAASSTGVVSYPPPPGLVPPPLQPHEVGPSLVLSHTVQVTSL